MKRASAALIRREMSVTAVTDERTASALMRRHDVESIALDGPTALFTITDFSNPFNAREFDEGSDKEKDLLKLEQWMLSNQKPSFYRRDDLIVE